MPVFPSAPIDPSGGAFPTGPTLSAHDRAARLAVLAGGTDALYQRARAALHSGDPQWAAALADHLLTLEPDRLDYHLLKGDALRAVGSRVLAAEGSAGAHSKAEAGAVSRVCPPAKGGDGGAASPRP